MLPRAPSVAWFRDRSHQTPGKERASRLCGQTLLCPRKRASNGMSASRSVELHPISSQCRPLPPEWPLSQLRRHKRSGREPPQLGHPRGDRAISTTATSGPISAATRSRAIVSPRSPPIPWPISASPPAPPRAQPPPTAFQLKRTKRRRLNHSLARLSRHRRQ